MARPRRSLPSAQRLPDPLSGPALLRAFTEAFAIARGVTQGWIAREMFDAPQSSLSEWCNGAARPNAVNQRIARDWAGVPDEAWETADERAHRLKVKALGEEFRGLKAVA